MMADLRVPAVKKAESASPPVESQESQSSNASKSSTKSKPTMTKSNKRKASSEPEAPVAKKVRASALLKDDEKNAVPTQRMHVYVFGEGSSGELGLGTAKNAIDVKRMAGTLSRRRTARRSISRVDMATTCT